MRPRAVTHVRDGVLLATAGIAAAGVAPLAGYPYLAVPALVGGLGSGAAVAVTGERAKRRGELQDRVLEALAPLLGVRQLDRRIVKLRRWSGTWPGLPGWVRIYYAPGAPDNDPLWKDEICARLAARLLGRYRVTRHDPLRCTLWLELIAAGTEAEPPYAQVRAERAITELIGVTARVTAVELDGEDLRSITVAHQAAAKLSAAGYRNRIERVISTMMPGRWRAVWDLERDEVRFEVRPTLPTCVWMSDRPAALDVPVDDLLRNYREVRIPCAIDEDGREVAWYPARVPHVMLTGGTGTGKTSMAHSLLGQITAFGWPVWILDAKRVEFLALRTWPNVQIVAGAIWQQVALVRAAWELMEYRYSLIEAGQAQVSDFEPLVVFLDEFAEFRSNLGEWYAQIKVKGDPSRPPTLAEVASLARKGRTARVHLVLSTQRPDAEFLGGEMRDNFGMRLSMGRLSPQGAMMMWESPVVGVTLPRACTGRAMATHEDGRPVEVQCYRFPDLEAAPGTPENDLLEAIRPTEARWPRLIIIPPHSVPADDDLDPETAAEVTEPTFRDYAHAAWDLASARPDLDPLTPHGRVAEGTGRELSSTLASLGIRTRIPTPRPRVLELVVSGADPVPPATHGAAYALDGYDEDDDYDGYLPAVPVTLNDLSVGDLIEVDEGSGVWVVVDEMPEEDLLEPGMVAISWRGDGDESGSISLADDTRIPVRRPEELSG
jgi:S-DNA-T family DNA segregation ATPase FtsK/SpoIIIE